MFRLLHFFLLTSTVGLLALAALAWFAHGYAVRQLVAYAETQNVSLARSFANTIWPKFSPYSSSILGLSGEEMRQRPEIRDIEEAVKIATAGLSILKVKVYNLDGITIFSSDIEEIGQDNSNNPGFLLAARVGQPASKLTFKNRLNTFEGTFQNRDIVESYLPIQHGDGDIHGVFELYSDVTQLLSRINRSTVQLLVGLLIIFGLLYTALYFLVRRADHTIKRQYSNIEEKNEALRKARNTLEIRVADRTLKLTEEIAERTRAEENLRKLSQAVEQSPAMIIITNVSGNIEYVNSRFSDVTGYTLDEVIGKNPRMLKAGELPPETYQELWETIKAGEEWRGEIQNRKKNGELYWALSTISPVLDSNDRVTHFLGISEDITELKIAAQEKRQQQLELAHAGRVIILGEMATSIAHELNQPLAVISGCAQLCRKVLGMKKNQGETLKDSIDQVIEQADRANDIIHSIRSFVHKDPPKHETISVNDAIKKIADLLRTDAREHGASITFNFANKLRPVAANMLQIQQVILNLAHNGIEAMMGNEPAERQLIISSHGDDGGGVGISVCDRGEGLTPENLERIFEPFYTTKIEGIGLGLSISRSIVEAHGGKLTVDSSKEHGTKFHIYLPTISEEAIDDQ
ncbi:MAG: PAS domain S-box protein [Hyphomicrobiales bacterium]|nr:PAS domain S-box protein [Hyphomicrobiales bacterium]